MQIHSTAHVSEAIAVSLQKLKSCQCDVLEKRSFAALVDFILSDVIHYHSNTWFRKPKYRHFDYHIAEALKKIVVFHFHGSDLRVAAIHKILENLIEDHTILVSTPDLLDYVPTAIWLPNPILLESYEKNVHVKNHPLHVGYYKPPIDEYTKNIYTIDTIEKAIKQLHCKPCPLYGIPYENLPHHLNELDIFIDRLGMGWYGLMACEAMASGVPVITNVRKDLETYLNSGGERAFLMSSAQTVNDDLEELANSVDLRSELSDRGRLYVAKVHSSDVVAKKLIGIYKREKSQYLQVVELMDRIYADRYERTPEWCIKRLNEIFKVRRTEC